jgi:hypothetical protein
MVFAEENVTMTEVSNLDDRPASEVSGDDSAPTFAVTEEIETEEYFAEETVPEDYLEPAISAEDTDEAVTAGFELALRPAVRVQIMEPRLFLNYSLIHNQIPLFSRVGFHNKGETKAHVTLHVEVIIDGETVGHAASEKFDLDMDVEGTLPGTALPLRISPKRMLDVEWNEPAELRARLVWNEKIIAEHCIPTTVLSSRQWVASEGMANGEKRGFIDPLSLEMLAAFVQPQHPAIRDLLADAHPLLQGFGISGFAGYQMDDPNAIDTQVRAVGEAMRKRNIVYHNPEPGWVNGGGQLIRTPEDVLEGREGTCLDTTAVLAAALERIGINPLIFLIMGHAFLGYWRSRGNLPTGFLADSGSVQGLIASGFIGFVETTSCTTGNESLSWNDITEQPLRDRLKADFSNFEAIIDVAASRRISGIFPIPARTSIDGVTQVVVYGGPLEEGAREHVIRVERGGKEQEEKPRTPAPPRVQFWKNAMLDLSLRNALINYREQRGAQLLAPGNQLGQFEDVLIAGQTIALKPKDDLPQAFTERGIKTAEEVPDETLAELLFSHGKLHTGLTSGSYESVLTRLQYRARTYRQETGANNLYVAIGMLSWTFKGQQLESPLILVPVKLERPAKSGDFRITLDDTGESTPNFSLLEKLRRELGLELPEIWAPNADQSGLDIDKTFADLQKALNDAGKGDFLVKRSSHMAILQFSKFRLWKDLNEHWEEFAKNPVVDHLALHSHEIFEDPIAAPEDVDLDALLMGCPLPADGSQLKAISHALVGRSFVLEGPPGTGKSQTITNMLARAMAEGKKVLFVAEKSQALSVVKKRLDAVGLGALSLDIHDKSSSPAEIKAQILASLDAVSSFENSSLDDVLSALDGSQQLLQRYTERLGEVNAAGFSLYEALVDSLRPREDVPALTVPESVVAGASEEELRELRNKVAALIDLEGSVRVGQESPWRFLGTALEEDTVSAFLSAVNDVSTAFEQAQTRLGLAPVLALIRTPADAAAVGQILDRHELDREKLREILSIRWEKTLEALLGECEDLAKSARPALLTFTAEVLNLDLENFAGTFSSLGSVGFFEKSKVRKELLGRLSPFTRTGQKIERKRLESYLRTILELRGEADNLTRRIRDESGIGGSKTVNPLIVDGRALIEGEADRLRGVARHFLDNNSEESAPALDVLIKVRDTLGVDDAAAMGLLQSALSTLAKGYALQDDDFARWVTQDSNLSDTWQRTSSGRGATPQAQQASVQSWLGLLDALKPLEDTALHEACAQILDGHVRLSDASLGLANGMAVASVSERVSALGLQEFDGANHDIQVNRYSRSLARLRGLLPESLAHTILNTRPFDASAARGRIAQLRTQVTKKRGGLTIRALFAEFSDIIPNLLPCVMTNPDSIARLFPPRANQFDLVIFDEASQIRVAEAIGAMGRAKSVVVVGDSRQMPPTNFAKVTDDIGDTDEVESLAELEGQLGDQESLLDECKDVLSSPLELTWHYRSQDESLIAFSNDAYYNNKLSSFPTPDGVDGKKDFGISFVKVDSGTAPKKFLQTMLDRRGKLPTSTRVNLEEVYAITQEIKVRFDASRDKVPSIGVLTFNLEQRGLVEKALNALGDDRISAALRDDSEEGLFVKNIEYVQGDERDTILFSIGRVPGPDGLVALSGFGPLTQRGGHRRFNVAITRARQQVVIFCSFLPGQLAAETATNQGIKDLKAYLQWARSEREEFGSGPIKKALRDAHRDDVAEALRAKGLEVTTDLGLSDFRIDLSVGLSGKKAGTKIAVLLDGPPWRARSTIFDRDVLPIDVLKQLMGWSHVVRIWTPEWLKDPVGVVARISETLERISDGEDMVQELDQLEEPAVAAVRSDPQVVNKKSADFRAPVMSGPGGETWTPFTESYIGSRDFLDYLPGNRKAVEGVQTMMRTIVDKEGPVSFTRLSRLTAAAFGLTKVNATREAVITSVIPKDMRKTRDENYAWQTTLDSETWRGFRPSDDYLNRPLEVISKREISNAMAHHASRALGMSQDDVFRETLASFGAKRMTSRIEILLEDALRWGLEAGRLTQDAAGNFLGE